MVIGRTATNVGERALDYVAGYACFNDGTLRDYQRKTSQWTIGKNFDRTGGFGPELVTPDKLPVGASGLRIVSRLNGEIMQDGNTGDHPGGGDDARAGRRHRHRHARGRRLRPQAARLPQGW